jgi:hypothetical protein
LFIIINTSLFLAGQLQLQIRTIAEEETVEIGFQIAVDD